MAQKPQEDKTEEPTLTRLKKAREEGNVAKSAELSSVILLLAILLLVLFFGASMFVQVQSLFARMFAQSELVVTDNDYVLSALNDALFSGMTILMPFILGLLIVALLANVLQTGFVIAPKALEPKPGRMNPAKGLKKIFSTKGVFELFKGIIKIGITGSIIYYTVAPEMELLTQLMIMPLFDSLVYSGNMLLVLVARMMAALLILSALDAMYARYQHRKELRMTKQEVKDEMKNAEGDPKQKSRRRAMALDFLRGQRLDHAVLRSDVVLTNPTHYSVALQYDPSQNHAPVVSAMGKDNRALKIREFARMYNVPIEENPPLTRALYAVSQEGESIPYEHFQAVATILAHVYKSKNKDIYSR